MSETIRWGIIGTGQIAGALAHGLSFLSDAALVAIGSRTQAAADKFGEEYEIPHRHASYEALAHDPDVDVVYISTPHHLHYENTMLCLEAGKAVLCEKPFAINAAQAAEMIALARQKNVFLMEAMWTRFLPSVAKVRDILASGVLGEILTFSADFGFRANFDPQSRIFDPNLGGGALLDVGIYPISFASMLFGSPDEISSQVHLGRTGVDELCAAVLRYNGGKMAQVSAAVVVWTPQEAVICGTQGRLKLHSPFFMTQSLTLTTNGEDRVIEEPFEGSGYRYEVAEVMACLRAGKTESSIMPLDETLSIMQTLDQLRAQWGIKYPME